MQHNAAQRCQTQKFLFLYNARTLCIVDHYSYLGVVLGHKLSWEPHQNYISNKVNCLLAFLNRNIPRANQRLREYSYKQLVLPVLDYYVTIWDPYYQNSIHRIEMLQNRAARFVFNRPWRRHYHESVSSMISTLNWQSLQQGGEMLN